MLLVGCVAPLANQSDNVLVCWCAIDQVGPPRIYLCLQIWYQSHEYKTVWNKRMIGYLKRQTIESTKNTAYLWLNRNLVQLRMY